MSAWFSGRVKCYAYILTNGVVCGTVPGPEPRTQHPGRPREEGFHQADRTETKTEIKRTGGRSSDSSWVGMTSDARFLCSPLCQAKRVFLLGTLICMYVQQQYVFPRERHASRTSGPAAWVALFVIALTLRFLNAVHNTVVCSTTRTPGISRGSPPRNDVMWCGAMAVWRTKPGGSEHPKSPTK